MNKSNVRNSNNLTWVIRMKHVKGFQKNRADALGEIVDDFLADLQENDVKHIQLNWFSNDGNYACLIEYDE